MTIVIKLTDKCVFLFGVFFFQLENILSLGFQNKFYNASEKDPGQSSSPHPVEYRINVSSDTPHWYIRDYLARVSSNYDIINVDVDGKHTLLFGF